MSARTGEGIDGIDVAVIGAGVVGLCCALSLQQRGARVTLIDRAKPGEGCSFGNAGMIQTGSSLPLAAPGFLAKVPRMLLDPEGPLSLRWRHLPALLPWGYRLAHNARREKAKHSERLLAGLLKQARPAWAALSGNSAAAEVFRPRGELYVVRSEAAFGGYAEKIETCRRNCVPVEVLDEAGVRRYEPQLDAAYRYGIYLPDSAHVADPLLLSQRMFDNLLRAGGTFRRGAVRRVERCDSGASIVLDDGQAMATARIVIAAGALSGRLARDLGLHLPIEPLRGYHVMMPQMETPLAGPVIEGEMNIAITPMTGGNRVAGTIEFAGHKAKPNWRRADILAPMARRMVPALTGAPVSRWSGDRPGTPDSLPIIGPAGTADDPVWFACGHGTLGLTLAAATAEILAKAMLGGAADRAALAPFQANRFDASAF